MSVFPCLYGLIRSCLHARGSCELSSASAGYMSLPSGTFRAGTPCWHPPCYVPLRYLCRPSSITGGRECRLGFQFTHTLQFACNLNTPRLNRVLLTAVNSANEASVLQQEVSSLLLKEATEDFPSSDLNHAFFSRYFRGLRPILDLHKLNYSLYRGKFRMLTQDNSFPGPRGGLVRHC